MSFEVPTQFAISSRLDSHEYLFQKQYDGVMPNAEEIERILERIFAVETEIREQFTSDELVLVDSCLETPRKVTVRPMLLGHDHYHYNCSPYILGRNPGAYFDMEGYWKFYPYYMINYPEGSISIDRDFSVNKDTLNQRAYKSVHKDRYSGDVRTSYCLDLKYLPTAGSRYVSNYTKLLLFPNGPRKNTLEINGRDIIVSIEQLMQYFPGLLTDETMLTAILNAKELSSGIKERHIEITPSMKDVFERMQGSISHFILHGEILPPLEV